MFSADPVVLKSHVSLEKKHFFGEWGVSEPLDRSKMAITFELNLCLSNVSRGIEEQKERKLQVLL